MNIVNNIIIMDGINTNFVCTRPPTCFTCGKVNKWVKFFEMLEDYTEEDYKTTSPKDIVLDKLGVMRKCCRRMYHSHPKELEKIIEVYNRNLTE